MWLREKFEKHKDLGRGALIFIGVLLLLFVLFDADFAFKNIAVFFSRHGEQKVAAITPAAAKPDMLSIPSLNISAPVIYIDKTGEKAYVPALAKGVVHYPGTALPGAFGNDYIFGHSSDLPWSNGNYKTIFAPLPQIAIGDKIFLTDHEGQVFTYTVFETKIVTPNDLSVLGQFDNKQKLLSLQTSYPLGTALKRFIVLARIEDGN